MDQREDGNRCREPLRLGLRLAVVAVTVVLSVAFGQRLNEAGQAVLAGGICLVGAGVTTALLLIFVRQYYDSCR